MFRTTLAISARTIRARHHFFPRLQNAFTSTGGIFGHTKFSTECTQSEDVMALPKAPKVAVAQMTSTGSQQDNFQTCTRLTKEASGQGCAMIFFPECFSFIGLSQQESIDAAQPLTGPLMQEYRDLARAQSIWLSLGGFQETGPDPEHIYNSHVIVNDDGEIAAVYRKVHLFNVSVPNGPVLMESNFTAPGSQIVTCDTPIGRLGMATCYDLRFPNMFQQLTTAGGAQVLLVPSAFTRPTGEAHWHVLLRARAIENQAFVIASAQAGVHNSKRTSFGHSLIIDPWGTITGSLEDPLRTGIAVAEIDLDAISTLKAKMPVQQHQAAGLSAVTSPIVHYE